MTREESQFLAERAEQLALLYILRRHELRLIESRAGSGPDLLVALSEQFQYRDQLFGVEVKALRSSESLRQGIAYTARPASFPFPIFLFVFAMEDDAGYYCWLNNVPEDSERRKRLPFSRFTALGEEEIDHIIELVRSWYRQDVRTYRALIDGDWTVDDFSDLFAPYSQVYAFLESLGNPPPPRSENEKKLQEAYVSHPWRGGYSRVNFFNDLKSLVPAPPVASLQYASPGWMELDISVQTALRIQFYIRSYIRSKSQLADLESSTNGMLRKRNLTKRNARSAAFVLSEEDHAALRESIVSFSELLGFEHLDRLEDLAPNPLVTLKILMAFCVRIQALAEYQMQGMVTY